MSMVMLDRESARLAGEIATLTGESHREVVRKALLGLLQRERMKRGDFGNLADAIREIGEHCAALPDFDPRTPDEIIGYDENGMW